MASARITALKELALKDYQAYLQTEHWLTIRHAALGRALFACALCNSRKDLQVHHRCYDHLGEEYDSDTIVLCAECHTKHHFGDNHELEHIPSDEEIAEFMDGYGGSILDAMQPGQRLPVNCWSVLAWVLTGVPTWTHVIVMQTVSTGEERVSCSFYPVSQIVALDGPWAESGLMTHAYFPDWLEDPELREIAIVAWREAGVA